MDVCGGYAMVCYGMLWYTMICYGMVWFWLLGLSASLLAVREAGVPLPQKLLGPRATLNPEHQDQLAHIAFREVYFPCPAVWCASPANS